MKIRLLAGMIAVASVLVAGGVAMKGHEVAGTPVSGEPTTAADGSDTDSGGVATKPEAATSSAQPGPAADTSQPEDAQVEDDDNFPVDTDTPGAITHTEDISGVEPTPKPAPVLDLSTKPQEHHGPGGDAAVDTGYTTGLKGCQLECIHTAKVSATGTAAEFTVGTHVPTRMWVILTGVGSQDSGAQLTETWSPTFTGLTANRKYDVTVVAEDADGHARHLFGSFTTQSRKALVTFHKIHVIGDADKGVNSGEIRFQFRVADNGVAKRDSEKIKSGTWLTLRDGRGKPGGVVENAPKKLFVSTYGIERDPCGGFHGASVPSNADIQAGRGGSCWDVAAARRGFDLDSELGGGESASFTRTISTSMHKLKFDVIVRVDVWHE